MHLCCFLSSSEELTRQLLYREITTRSMKGIENVERVNVFVGLTDF